MELLCELTEKDVGIKPTICSKYAVRKAARAVLFNSEGKVALLNVGKLDYYKIPGGGVEGEEDIAKGLEREILEETGCKAKVTNEVGMIIEYRSGIATLQINYCFIAKVQGKPGAVQFTKEELDRDFKLKWVTLDEAIILVKNAKPSSSEYDPLFIQKRDLTFLQKAKSILS